MHLEVLCSNSRNKSVDKLLSNAAIIGTLPDDVFEFLFSLSILELMGNRGLTGSLLNSLSTRSLYVLDLPDNAFNGAIPKGI